MDRLIYTAMTGAKQIMEQQATISQNLANTNTIGFKGQIDMFRAVPVRGPGLSTRVQVVDETVGADLSVGKILQTGRNLDIAVEGSGWIAVQTADGKEAYTRAGDLNVGANGLLQSHSGLAVLSEEGTPISISADSSVMVGKDGTLSYLINGDNPVTTNFLGRIKLVNPSPKDLTRGEDGLFYPISGNAFSSDLNVSVQSGALEESNINVVDTMVAMISLGRQFEMQMNMLKNEESNSSKSSSIMSLT